MGIEIKARLVENADRLSRGPKELKPLIFSFFNARILPEEISDYEVVYMIDVFHHIPPPQQSAFMEHPHQKMKPGATLGFKDIKAGSLFVVLNKLHDLVFPAEAGNQISKKTALKLLSNSEVAIKSSLTRTLFCYTH